MPGCQTSPLADRQSGAFLHLSRAPNRAWETLRARQRPLKMAQLSVPQDRPLSVRNPRAVDSFLLQRRWWALGVLRAPPDPKAGVKAS